MREQTIKALHRAALSSLFVRSIARGDRRDRVRANALIWAFVRSLALSAATEANTGLLPSRGEAKAKRCMA
jgi:hypothetical protein